MQLADDVCVSLQDVVRGLGEDFGFVYICKVKKFMYMYKSMTLLAQKRDCVGFVGSGVVIMVVGRLPVLVFATKSN
jgi:hypothetical protein